MTLNIHQKIIVTLSAIIFVTFLYEQLFHALMWLFHILFESAEYVLDFVIESLFEIGSHETQIIVFYILVAVISFSVYRLYLLLPRWYHKLKHKLFWHKNQTIAQWQALSVIGKMSWSFFCIVVMGGWLFLT